MSDWKLLPLDFIIQLLSGSVQLCAVVLLSPSIYLSTYAQHCGSPQQWNRKAFLTFQVLEMKCEQVSALHYFALSFLSVAKRLYFFKLFNNDKNNFLFIFVQLRHFLFICILKGLHWCLVISEFHLTLHHRMVNLIFSTHSGTMSPTHSVRSFTEQLSVSSTLSPSCFFFFFFWIGVDSQRANNN